MSRKKQEEQENAKYPNIRFDADVWEKVGIEAIKTNSHKWEVVDKALREYFKRKGE